MAKKVTPEMRAAHERLRAIAAEEEIEGNNSLVPLAVGDGNVCDGAASTMLLYKLAHQLEQGEALGGDEGDALIRLLLNIAAVSEDETRKDAWKPTARNAFAGPGVKAIGRLKDWDDANDTLQLGAELHLRRNGEAIKTTARAWAEDQVAISHRGLTKLSNRSKWEKLCGPDGSLTAQADRALRAFNHRVSPECRDAIARAFARKSGI